MVGEWWKTYVKVPGPLGFVEAVLPGVTGVLYVLEFIVFNCFLIEEAIQIYTRLMLKYMCPTVKYRLCADLSEKAKGSNNTLKAGYSLLAEINYPGWGSFKAYADATDNCIKAAKLICERN